MAPRLPELQEHLDFQALGGIVEMFCARLSDPSGCFPPQQIS